MQEEHLSLMSDDDIYSDPDVHNAVESVEPQHGMESEMTSKDSTLHSTLDSLGIRCFLDEKLTIDNVREIRQNVSSDQTATDLQSQLQFFLERLLMLNMKARSLKKHNDQDSSSSDGSSSDYEEEPDRSKDINPLDLITALFLCSDGILQQELSLKMSLCQFAVPLLLPNPDTHQSTLMLWAMRDIVKQFSLHSPDNKNEFVDKSVVYTKLPMISFVRLGSSSLSKSKFLNEILSNSQQTNNTFVHHNMTGGNISKKISDGLVEISWYLPSGNPDIDIFTEPVAVANLRGDLQTYQTEFAFLCQTSAAVFVFCDDLHFDTSILSQQSQKKKVFIVCDSQSKGHDEASFKELASELKNNSGRVIKKGHHMNDADLVKKIRSAVKDVLKLKPFTMKVEEMVDVAHKLRIRVDEDYGPCQRAKSKAEKVINFSDFPQYKGKQLPSQEDTWKELMILEKEDIPKYKDSQLPLQGDAWKELATLEKEECKRTKLQGRNVDEYMKEIMQKKETLRMSQKNFGMSQTIKYFIEGLKSSDEERSYFLKWMKINLDNLSRTQLSKLRKNYRDICQKSPERKDLITNLDKQISKSSLGTEHFFREVAQLYEASMFFAETTDLKEEIQDLPKICAELMLAGFPLELMDGDASNIPMTWITEVLKELDSLTTPNNKIRVVTVLGSQSSGKSTLLNTLFGVQFAVSSGRCTRGAFMQLIKVKQDFRNVIKCDIIMIIDTEGLKAVQLSHLTDNFEHDNELATLVVGLSDFSIVNIAMENNSDVRDLLQIVAHAFLRMKESGRMPTCQFVHQNVTDVSAPEKNLRDQNLLLDQLNEMTRVASRMENIAECKFTDIIIHKPEENCNIPGLWHGTPPMAPVNEGYSAAVSKLKQQLIKTLQNQTVAQIHPEFCVWLQDLWTAIKHENFIFSFRNSIVAEAYNKMCVEFNRWEWNFQMHMYNWLTKAEIRVANYGSNTSEEMSGLNIVPLDLKRDADHELDREGKFFLNNIVEYFKSQRGNVHLIEKNREDFKISAESQIKVMKSTVKKKLEVAVDVRRCTFGVDKIKKNNRDAMDKKVTELVKKFNKDDKSMNDEEIEQEFEKMWNKTVKELSFGGLEHQTVATNIYGDLKCNLEREGSTISEMLKEANPIDKCGNEEFKVKKEKRTVTRFFKETLTIGGEKMEVKRNKTQEVASDIIVKCKTFIGKKRRQRVDYHCTHFRELLEIIDENLNRHSDLHISAENAAALKIHVCGHAAREFQKMHDVFIHENDPRQNLEKFKPQYLADFKDLYYRKDLSHRKIDEFTNLCVKPAVKAYISKHLGKNILKEVQSNCHNFSSRRFFQFSIMKNLISSDFSTFLRCTDYYDGFSYEFILNAMVRHFSKENNSIAKMEVRLVKKICEKIQGIVSQISQKSDSDENDLTFTQFLQDLSSGLSSVLVIPNDTTGLDLETSKTKEFSNMFKESITKMEKCLIDEFCSDQDVLAKLSGLPNPPQDQLHSKIIGCGKQCPWCQAPCDLEGQIHTQHSALIHRPVGFGGYTWNSSGQLQTENCVFNSQTVLRKFWLYLTNSMNYNQNSRIWNPQPISSTVSDYWKFVFGKYNEEYAENHSALPAVIPQDWKVITSEQALKSLKEKYYPETTAV